MWIGIIAIVDKILTLLCSWLPWQLKRSDESKNKREAAEIRMLDAEFKGDFDAWKKARSDRNNA